MASNLTFSSIMHWHISQKSRGHTAGTKRSSKYRTPALKHHVQPPPPRTDTPEPEDEQSSSDDEFVPPEDAESQSEDGSCSSEQGEAAPLTQKDKKRTEPLYPVRQRVYFHEDIAQRAKGKRV